MRNLAHGDRFLRNRELNRDELTRRRLVLSSKPRKMGISLTERCNLRCRMCRIKNDKTWEIPGRAVRELLDWMPCLQHIQWLGGEVFLSRHFEELFDRAAAYPQLQQSINTNGLLITAPWAERLVKSAVRLELSIDGITPRTYEHIRTGGKFSVLVEKLDMLRSCRDRRGAAPGDGMTVSVNFTVMRSNYAEIAGIVDFARRHRIDAVQLSSLNETTPEEILPTESLDREAVRRIDRLMPDVLAEARASGITVYDRILRERSAAGGAPADNGSCAGPAGNAAARPLFCREPWQSLFIMPGPPGMVRPDCLCLANVGNVNTDSLEAIWNGEAMQAYRKRIIAGETAEFCNPVCTSGKKPEDFIH